MSEARIERPQAHTESQAKAIQTNNLKFAMWLFLASEVVIFTVLIGTYVLFSINHREVVHEIHESTINVFGLEIKSVFLVALNTFLLLTSSWAMVMGLREIQRGNRQGLIRWISITAVLGIVFLVFQYIEYGVLASKGVAINGTGPLGEFGMRFYTPTALHGAHVLGGVIWALLLLRHASRGGYQNNPVGVEIFGLYWHFVDVVWIVIFTVIYLI
jgi:heme/copper-type cytochrome/quinol oxidase subunit 3